MLGGAEEEAALPVWPWTFVLAHKCLRPGTSGFVIGVSWGPEGLDRGLGMKGLPHFQAGQCIRGVARPALMA